MDFDHGISIRLGIREATKLWSDEHHGFWSFMRLCIGDVTSFWSPFPKTRMEVLQQQRVRVLALSKIRRANRVYYNSLEKLLLSFSFLLSCTRYEQEYIGPSQPWIQAFVDLQKKFTSMGASQAVDLNFIISIN